MRMKITPMSVYQMGFSPTCFSTSTLARSATMNTPIHQGTQVQSMVRR